MDLWIIGAGGLFGSALTRQAHRLGHLVTTSTDVPWNDHAAARKHLVSQAEQFIALVQRDHKDLESTSWAVVWAAGKATTASSEAEAGGELSFFTSILGDLARVFGPLSTESRGRFLLASSAGGVYAGSSHPPFDSRSTPVSLSPYGRLKLEQERVAVETLSEIMGVVIARIANLYGPGQNLGKLQGLISRLALSSVTRDPITMFVPLDTLRDYIYADDAAAISLHWLDCQDKGSTVRVIASGEPTSLGHLIGLMQDIARTRLPVAYGIHDSASAQAHDLRLIPDQDSFVTSMPRVALPAGMKSVYLDILARHQASQSRVHEPARKEAATQP